VQRPIFFCHIPKTAGSSLRFAIEATIDPLRTLPSPAMMSLVGGHYPPPEIVYESLLRDPGAFRLVRGHYHFSLREMIADPINIVVLRDPVERVISNLQHNIQHNGYTLERVITDLEKGILAGVVPNHMTRYLGGNVSRTTPQKMEVEHNALLYGPMPDGRTRLASAIAALESIDILGDMGEPSALAADLAGIGIALPKKRVNVSGVRLELTDAQKERIREINGLDVELYERAKETGRQSAP
jgi:hypothetical protein